MRFSSRVPPDLRPNRLARALERLRAQHFDIVDLTESNPTRVGLAYPPRLLDALADPRGLLYEPSPLGLAEARAAVAADFARRGRPVAPDRIVLTSSTSEAYSILFKLLCDPGDAVLAPRPSYPLFEHLTRLEAVVETPYALEYHGAWSLDFDSLERALQDASRPRAILVVNPNNPTGSFLRDGELPRLAALCRDRGLALIGDEVFWEYVHDGVPVSVLDQAEALTFCLGGLSKSVGLPQLKLSWIGIGGPEDLVREARACLEHICDTYLSVSTPVQLAAARLLAEAAGVREQIARRITANRQRLRACARAHPACDVLHVDGGWYAVVQAPAVEPEEQVVVDLLERERVLVHPGYFFEFPREAFFVVSLLPDEDRFTRGIGKLLARVDWK